MAGYAGLVVFVAILVVALIYEYRMGALDWEPVRLRMAKAGREKG